MYSLFCEAKFWTLKNDIQIRNTDFGVLRYYDKKEIDECPYLEGKKSYCCQRGATYVLKNKRPFKLKDNLKELEQQFLSNKIVYSDWKNDNILNIILNTGLIITIGVNVSSKDIYKITFDRFLIGKLLSENVCDVLSTKTHLVISYNENQLTIVNYTKPSAKFYLPQKLTKLEPKVQLVVLCGPAGRRLERRLSCNKSGDMILTWWHSTRNEVYPWSPLVKDEDRANIHLYSLEGTKLELLCFYRTDFDLVNVNFSQLKPNLFWMIEQKVSKKGEVVIEYSSHEIVKKRLKKISVTSIPLQTQICCHSISPDEEKLVLGCIDGSLILFDEPKGITRLVKTAFIPNLVSWHNDGALVIIANERSQFQFFDFGLSCLRAQLLSEDVTPSNILDLSSYFKTQPTLVYMKWNKKPDASCYMEKHIPNDSLLFLIFENGPLGVVNLIGGGGLLNDVQNCGLTPDTIIRQYLMWNQCDKALNLLLSLNWNTNGPTCLAGLYHIANHIFRQPFSPEKEVLLEAALGSFYSPIRPLTKFSENEFGNQVHDLTRRFFYHLLRHRLFEKAYCLAIDLGSSDLFVDLYHCAKLLKDEEMAFACRTKFEEFLCLSDSSSRSCCSHSACSSSESNTENEEDEEEDAILPPLPQVCVKKSKASRVPPLPDLNRPNKLRESAFFNYNSAHLQSDPINSLSKEMNSELPNEFESRTASTSFNELYPSFLNQASKFSEVNSFTPQISTPDFTHSYEIRTSFSGEEGIANNFAPIESARQKFTEHKTLNNLNVFQTPNGSMSALKNFCDASNASARQGEYLKKDFWLSHSNPALNNSRPLKLKSAQGPRENQLHVSSSSINPFCSTKNISYEQLSTPPPPFIPGPFYVADKQVVKTGLPINSNSYLARNSTPKPEPYVPFFKNFNNYNYLVLQRPLQFVPNGYTKPITKPSLNSTCAKQKVKFSDTVTQIVVPDISKITIEDETLASEHSARTYRNPKPALATLNSDDSSCRVEKLFDNQQEQHDEEENNGRIKVIHFGVV